MIPILDLRAQYLGIKDEITAAIGRVLESGQYVLGEEVTAFEREFADYCGARYGIAVNSGTSALHLALLAAGIGPGDEVITVPFTFVATVAAIQYAGARPVFVDIDPCSLTMAPDQIEPAITPRTKAVVPVHLHGRPAEMESIVEIARRRQLLVIEDAAQGHGAEYHGHRVGSLGDLACFSFYPGKNLGAYGEGGLVTTDCPEFDRAIRMLRDWGAARRYHHELKGFNYRMDGIQGAILRVKLRYLESWTEARRTHAARYDRLLAGGGVETPARMANGRHVYHVYAVRHALRNDLQAAVGDEGIQTSIHYPVPVHLQPAYADLGYQTGDFPNSERAANEVLSLPMFPELSQSQIVKVCEAIRRSATNWRSAHQPESNLESVR
jgi:dTDP-4-amino-4,6-dideoxygalactose transaminase